jgi:hypothetical protein
MWFQLHLYKIIYVAGGYHEFGNQHRCRTSVFILKNGDDLITPEKSKLQSLNFTSRARILPKDILFPQLLNC